MQKYAIIDVETTGGAAKHERITEIAIVLHDGEKVLESFTSLVNPERSIPWNITRITGITDQMVANAPKFYEIARKIVEITENAVFVAHNVRFDYEFIREEFARLGYSFSRKRLCTVVLSRKSFPGLRSYSLSNLKAHFGIFAERSHRALDDTLATVQIFERILAASEATFGSGGIKHFISEGAKLSKLPKSMTLADLEALPDATGVYYFHNSYGDVIYVGKSIDIRKRVFEHFQDVTRKSGAMQDQTHTIHAEVTGSELGALLLESAEIKRLLPPINKAQRARQHQSAIYTYLDQVGYRRFLVAPNSADNRSKMKALAEYPKVTSARGHLESLMRVNQLCAQLCHLEPPGTACFHYHIKKCAGACVGAESVDDYNDRADVVAASLYRDLEGSFLIIEPGRNREELFVAGVRNGRFVGMAHLERDWMSSDPIEVLDQLSITYHDPEAERIIRHYLLKNKPKLIPLAEEVDR
jgi:DNA polymerase III subunit epsilon